MNDGWKSLEDPRSLKVSDRVQAIWNDPKYPTHGLKGYVVEIVERGPRIAWVGWPADVVPWVDMTPNESGECRDGVRWLWKEGTE